MAGFSEPIRNSCYGFGSHNYEDEILSPTNGYFHDREHPQDMYVQNMDETDTKAAVATEDQDLERSLESSEDLISDLYTPSSLTRSSSRELEPLLSGSASGDVPPPAYSADQNQGLTNVHPLFSQFRTGAHAPGNTRTTGWVFESIGPPPPNSNPDRHAQRRSRKIKRIHLFTAFWFLVVMLVFLALWTGIGRHPRPPNRGEHPVPPDSHEPGRLPSFERPSHCSPSSTSKEERYHFESLERFYFEEQVDSVVPLDHMYGRVRIVSADVQQRSAVQVDIVATTNDQFSVKFIRRSVKGEGIELWAPELERIPHTPEEGDVQKPCVVVEVTVAVRADVELSEFEIGTKRLDIDLDSDFKATVEKSFLTSSSASIKSHSNYYSRETIIKVGSGAVSGHYNLYDLLSISTGSGSITVDVTPRKASKDDEKPAKLECDAKSGSITVRLPSDTSEPIPRRVYETNLKSAAGGIFGHYIHGTRTYMETLSGAIDVSILPYAADDYQSILKTSTTTGSSRIELESPYTGKMIKRLESSHVTQVGSLNLWYPQEWEGNISGSTKTGSLNLKGKDVVITEDRSGIVYKEISAHKGSGHLDGKLTFGATTGSVDVVVGDE